MNAKMLLMVGVFCLALCLALVLVTDDAHASRGAGADKSIAEQTGLGTKEIDKDRLPNKWEMGLAIGSFLGMIAVVRWL